VAAREAEAAQRARSAGAAGTDPRVAALRAAADRLERELRGFRSPLADREVAERQLAVLSGMSDDAVPDGAALRDALLLIAAALNSVSVLAPAVAQLREAVELFGMPRHRIPAARPAGS